MTKRTPRGQFALAGLALGLVVLFGGRWVAMVLADRWWAEAVAPQGVAFLTHWHLLAATLELAGLLVASIWCIGHLLIVVRSIGAVQIPRRLGDLEIRELLSPEALQTAAILGGIVLGLLLGSGGSAATPLVAQAWHGVHFGIADPVLGLDLGVYLVQLPLWETALTFARQLGWAALVGAGLCHFAVGGLRVSRGGVAMTDSARLQLGLLLAVMLVLAACGEALGPLRAVAGLERPALAVLAPATRWGVAGAWGISAIAVALWALRPAPLVVLIGLGLWAGPGFVAHFIAPMLGERPPVLAEAMRPITSRAVGLERMADVTAAADVDPIPPPDAGLWGRQALGILLQTNGARLFAVAPMLIEHHGGQVPSWLALRVTTDGTELVAVADDRLAPGGAAVSYRENDPADYPGIVSFRRLPPGIVRPDQEDTLTAQAPGGIPLGGAWRRLLLAWGTQTVGSLGGAAPHSALWWRMSPRERAARLFPPAWWDEAHPALIEGRLVWIVDGWLTAAGAPLAPAIAWEGEERRYARPGFLALVDALTGMTRFYVRPDADPLAIRWAERSEGLISPADSLPSAVRSIGYPDRWLAVQAWALEHGPYEGVANAATDPADSVLARPSMLWTAEGPVPELPVGQGEGERGLTGRIAGVLLGRPDTGPVLVRWLPGKEAFAPRALNALWQRFASYERLEDSVGAAGGRIIPSPIRYEVGPRGSLAVEVLYLVPAGGAPSVGWVNLARGERVGAARTPLAAWANLKGESAPIVPAPDLPDALGEARRWTARADSALRSGDLQAFGRAFDALKRVLGTP